MHSETNSFAFFSLGTVHQARTEAFCHALPVLARSNLSFVTHRHLRFTSARFHTALCPSLGEGGWLIGEDRWRFKFGLEPIPVLFLVFLLKVDKGRRTGGVIWSLEVHCTVADKQTPELSSIDLRLCLVLSVLFKTPYRSIVEWKHPQVYYYTGRRVNFHYRPKQHGALYGWHTDDF